MKLKYTLLAAVLVGLAATDIQADEDDPEYLYWKGEAYTLKNPDERKPVKKRGHIQNKRAAPAVPGSEGQQAMNPHGSNQAKEKRGKEGCEETLSC